MNKLYLRAVRRRAASAPHHHKAWRGSWNRARPDVAVSPSHHAAPLHAQWHRNAVTGVLECHWVCDAPDEPSPGLRSRHVVSKFRMQWRLRSAGMRPPSCQYANG
ncbi:hypothetical protein [Dyella psychrodurans]|uniref:Uncharacterized protein n=1 Tax=Dyella psychrodurans TaxID=1927960 RepID=A0A370X758_9GAMM|nr:hypothetical protein [Dyella psychrodurans]RDS84263.1 hypothetical protein DWU99_11005 [Dyella psychrodurans]